MVNQAITQIGLGTDPAHIGAIAAATDMPLGNEMKSPPNLFLRWEMNEASKRLLVGQSVLVEHSDGMVWRIINVSKDREVQTWALDSLTAYLTLDDLAGAEARVRSSLVLTAPDTITSVRLGTIAEQILNVDANPVEPLRVIRIVNVSFKQVPLSFAATPLGWTLQLTGDIYIPAREACARGEWLQPQLRQLNATLIQNALAGNERLSMANYTTVFEDGANGRL